MAGERLLYNMGSPGWHSVMTERGGMGEAGRQAQDGRDMYILMTDSHRCMTETNITP